MCPGFLVRSISLSVPANRFAVKREAGMATRPLAREVAPRLVWEGERISSASTVDFNVSLRPSDEEVIAGLLANDSTALEPLLERFPRVFLGVGVRIVSDYG